MSYVQNMYVIFMWQPSPLQMQDIERHLHVYIAADKWSTLINVQ